MYNLGPLPVFHEGYFWPSDTYGYSISVVLGVREVALIKRLGDEEGDIDVIDVIEQHVTLEDAHEAGQTAVREALGGHYRV